MLYRTAFITPALPILKPTPPTEPEWLHEVKIDGFRAQLHANGSGPFIYSRNGHDFTSKFGQIAACLSQLPVRSAIIDAEVVRCGDDGLPDFYALMKRGKGPLCAYCFDLLALNGKDLRDRPLVKRKAMLKKLLAGACLDRLRYSDEFDDPIRLLAAAEEMNLEGIVSKQRDGRYLAGTACGWVKVKTRSWRTANRERYKMFEGRA